jgi:hypothetical protein
MPQRVADQSAHGEQHLTGKDGTTTERFEIAVGTPLSSQSAAVRAPKPVT